MLPQEEWLPQAKQLAVGQKRRIQHNCGRTASLDVYNTPECWSCWCFRCHEGGRVNKTHQSIRVVQEDTSRIGPIPADCLHILQASGYEQRRIWELLASKGCPPGIIPEEMLWYSRTVNRVMIRQGKIACGRSLNAQQLPKWMVYGDWAGRPKMFWTRYRDVGRMVLVEDVLSAYKVVKAVEVYAPTSSLSVVATLGTVVTSASLKYVQGRDVLCMYDGDEAGRLGSLGLQRRLNVFGGAFRDVRPHSGDPKDMSIQEIAECLMLK